MEINNNKNNCKANNNCLRTEGLKIGYGKNIIIDDISFEVEKGKIYTLIGPNGSGKSTILKTITNQLKRAGGCVYLKDEDIKNMNSHEMAKTMSIVMTERIKTELMSCFDVIATGRYPYTGRMGILSKEDISKINEAIELVNAFEIKDKDFNNISDGQRQRVMLARAICQEPEVLILDEPTSFLDMKYKLEILSVIRALAKNKNIAVIMSLHELDFARMVSDMIICVEKDRVKEPRRVEEIFTGNYIQRLYEIDDNNYSTLTGNVYFSSKNKKNNNADEKKLEIFLISGGGVGIDEFLRLQRENITFAVGILSKNDVEYESARILANEVVAVEAFARISEEYVNQGKRLIDKCEKTVCLLENFGECNKENEILLNYAKEKNKLWQR